MLNHCSMGDLLALRDGDGSDAARRHLESCDGCRRELDALHQRVAGLKALSPLRAPRDRWSVVRDRAAAERRTRRLGVLRRVSVAAAATLAIAVGGQTMLRQRGVASTEADLVAVQRQSERLEDELRRFDPTSRVLSSTAASAIADLEDGIAVIDERLGQPVAEMPGTELIDLWRRRVQLMDQLVDVHVSRASYVGL